MNTETSELKKEEVDTNPDLITGEHGSHPVATGVGTAGGGLAGAAIGTAVAGPVGTVVGALIGAVAGAFGGKAAGEAIDPTVEDAYWKENHSRQPFADKGEFDSFQPAYNAGYKGYVEHGSGKTFDEAEPELQRSYEETNPALAWDSARDASKAAWTRVAETTGSVNVPITEEEVKVGKREVEVGSVNIRKEVHTETVNIPVELKREDIIVERVAVGQGTVPADAFQEGEVRIPVMREEAVVQKTATVTGEVQIRKSTDVKSETISETIRKEEVIVDQDGDISKR